MNDNTRTLIATALDEHGFLYSKGYVHGFRTRGATTRDTLALLGYFNTFLCDWWVRRFTDRHMTLPVLTNVPLPEWSPDQRQSVAELVSTLLVRGGTERLPGGEVIAEAESLTSTPDLDLKVQIEALTLKGFRLGYGEFQAVLADFSNDAIPEFYERKVQSQMT